MLLHGEPGQIDFVADPADPPTDPDDWHITEFGGGVMVLEPKCFGRLFLPDPSDEEDLEFHFAARTLLLNKKKAPNHRGQDEEPQGGYPHQISKPTKPAF